MTKEIERDKDGYPARELSLKEYRHYLAADIDCPDVPDIEKILHALFILNFNVHGMSVRAMSEQMRVSRDSLSKDLRLGELCFKKLYPIMQQIEAEAKKTTRWFELVPNFTEVLLMGEGATAEEAEKITAEWLREIKFDETKAKTKLKEKINKQKRYKRPENAVLQAAESDIDNELKDIDNEKT